MTPDRKIIEDCLAGKRKAYNALYNKYAALMLAVCMRYCKSREEAEDVLQEGFIKVFRNINNFRMDGSLEGWIRRIMVNTAIDAFNAKAKRFRYEENEIHDVSSGIDPEEDNDEPFNISVSKDQLVAIIQSLPDGYRMVFNLYAIEGYSHKEIAEKLQISLNTSKTQLFKARRILKEQIKGII